MRGFLLVLTQPVEVGMSNKKAALAFIALLLLAGAMGVSYAVVAAWLSPQTRTITIQTPVRPNEVAADHGQVRRKIAASRWWSISLTEGDIDGIVEVIAETNSGNILWIDDATHCRSVPAYEYGKLKEWQYNLAVPINDLKARRLFIRVDGDRRMTAEEAASRLLAALEKSEATDGAGR